MHLGLTPWRLADTMDAQSIGRQAVLAESWGYDSFWLPEHHFTTGNATPEPLLILAAVAAQTQTIRLGTTSYLLPLRHPVQVAEQVAVLDQLSSGRVIFGMGRGYAPTLFSVFGVAQAKKRAIFRERLEIIRQAWLGHPVSGPDATDPVTISPLPVQQPHPPLWVAAFGPYALKQAGSLGLPYLSSPMETLERLHDNFRLHEQACIDAGHVVPSTTPIMRSVFVAKSQTQARQVRERLDGSTSALVRGRDSSSTYSEQWAIIGVPEEVREQVEVYRDELKITHLVATRLRIGGVSREDLERSVALFRELVD